MTFQVTHGADAEDLDFVLNDEEKAVRTPTGPWMRNHKLAMSCQTMMA